MSATRTETMLIPLLTNRHPKPIDLGSGPLSASIRPDGRICSINGFHPRHGFVTLSPMEPFPNDKWYDSDFVRAYRRRIAEEPSGFGVVPQRQAKQLIFFFLGHDYRLFVHTFEDLDVYATFVAGRVQGQDVVIQRLAIINKTDREVSFPVAVGGRFSLNRCSYGQLTEAGPIPTPELVNAFSIQGHHISIRNPNLGARADVVLFDGERPLALPVHSTTRTEPIEYSHTENVQIGPNGERAIAAVYWIGEGEDSTVEITAGDLRKWHPPADWKGQSVADTDWKSFVIDRNVDYIVSCCAIPVRDGSVCVITDHQLLPLSWNRDSYYMILLLFATLGQKGDAGWKDRVQALIRGHLIWMFEDANRHDGYWGRAYLTNGYCKDKVFQLDQQCYPLLEICDYYDTFQDEETVRRVLPVAREILRMLLDYKDDKHWLFLTGETPADDEVEYPYHFSSQVLVWHTFKRLAELNRRLGVFDEDLTTWAERVKQDCLSKFGFELGGRRLFAYLTDLGENFQPYHDANDLPTVFAPLWGFCSKDDPTWLETMRFAFSTENKGGYYPGRFEGLGSVHTPHKWPLGDGQELLFARLTGDAARADRVLEKLAACVQWDGMYSEAVDENAGTIASRHWFSWPGAFIAYVLLQMPS